jgi:CRISPR-associated protein (TIGR02584 family)
MSDARRDGKPAAGTDRPMSCRLLVKGQAHPAETAPSADSVACLRRILVAVTGLSPQIVTETLYALAVERKPPWVPTEIRIITTRRGAQEARRTLLSEDPGWFYRLCADYRLPAIAFDGERIHVIAGPGGRPLDDILDEADNAAVADAITEQVRALTADAQTSLHVSIAGGRKTMGFYAGYALSLFGRAQDRLSHVLVSPPFELFPEFFYPAPHARFVRDRDGRTRDTREAEVHLADIPFVRLREGLPERVLQGHARFSEAVAEAQKVLPPALALDPETCTVTAAGKSFRLPPARFAFYWMLAERCREGRGGVLRTDKDIQEDDLGGEFLRYYGRLVNVASGLYDKAEKAYRSFDTASFDQAKAKLNQVLRRTLGERGAAPYLIGRLDPLAGSRRHRFGLALPPAAITIAPASLPIRRTRAAGINARP